MKDICYLTVIWVRFQTLPNWISGVLLGNLMRLLSSYQGTGTSVIPEVTNREKLTSKFTLGSNIQLGPKTELLPNMEILQGNQLKILQGGEQHLDCQKGTAVYNLISWRYSITAATFYH